MVQTTGAENEETRPRRARRRLVLAAGALSAALLVAFGGSALARPPGGGFGGGGAGFGCEGGPGHGPGGGMGLPGFRLLRLIRNLDLTEEQELKALRIRRAMAAEHATVRDDIHRDAQELITELQKPTPDAARLHALADARILSFSKLAHTGIDKFLEFYRTLSDAQKKELLEEAKDMQKRMEERRSFFDERGKRPGAGKR